MHFLCAFFALVLYRTASASTVKSLKEGTFTLTYKGRYQIYGGPAIKDFTGTWVRDEAAQKFLKYRETDLSVWMTCCAKRIVDEFQLYLPNDDGTFTKYSGSKRAHKCKAERVEALPTVDRDVTGYVREGNEEITIADEKYSAERWIKRYPIKCAIRPRGHTEYAIWWFAKLGEPPIEVPVKYKYEYSYACLTHTSEGEADNWWVTSFDNDVDQSMFELPEPCKEIYQP